MKIVRTDLCAGCGLREEPLYALEFENADGVARHLCADCIVGIADAMNLPLATFDAYVRAYVAAVLCTPVSVVSDDG